MAPTPSKMAKLADKQQSQIKLWTHEDRMFNERFFYLNKSTTKYVIVGHDARTLEALVRICDRATGSYITITKMNFQPFMLCVRSLMEGTYSMGRGCIEGTGPLCGIKFSSVTSDIWKLSQVDLNHANVLIHKSTFNTLMRIEELITMRITDYTPSEYLEVIETIRQNCLGMDEAEIFKHLYEAIKKYQPGDIAYRIHSDLICNRDSNITLTVFCEGFYSRNNYK